ncbi:MAG: FAD-dependent oxidoreductase [Bacteroides cellulosilyticus]
MGGTPGGLTTALAAAKLGKTSLFLERTQHIGGLPSNGLGATDIVTSGSNNRIIQRVHLPHQRLLQKKYGVTSILISEM